MSILWKVTEVTTRTYAIFAESWGEAEKIADDILEDEQLHDYLRESETATMEHQPDPDDFDSKTNWTFYRNTAGYVKVL